MAASLLVVDINQGYAQSYSALGLLAVGLRTSAGNDFVSDGFDLV